MKERIIEIDFIKGILITLMVLFHFTLFTSQYENLTKWVYCFHMSSFMIISGYLQKNNIIHSVKRILMPYILFELLYIIGLSVLGSQLGSENTIQLSIFTIFSSIFISPIGTYWYLHTLFICILISYIISLLRLNDFSKFLITGSILFILSLYIEGLKWENVIYFLIGCFIQKLNLKINNFIIPSLWSVIPLILISFYINDLYRGNILGIGLTLFIISFLWAISKYVTHYIKEIVCYLGRNSFCILIFSPMFTVLTKQYSLFFTFDPSHILWAISSLIFVIILCLFAAWLCDILKISQYITGGKMYSQYK